MPSFPTPSKTAAEMGPNCCHPTPPPTSPGQTASFSSTDLRSLLAALEPVLLPGVFVYTSVPIGTPLERCEVMAAIRETKGLALVVSEEEAARHGLVGRFRAAWISLTVHSDLEAVGLTAAVASALAAAGISCNVLAGLCHDHLLVPADRGEEALSVLRTLQHHAAHLPTAGGQHSRPAGRHHRTKTAGTEG